MDFVLYIAAGAAVGLTVGLTGIGGGSLMTPLLILFGFPYNVAIGTDLLYAAITKTGGAVAHSRQGSVQWPLVRQLATGSIPAAIATALALKFLFTDADAYKEILTRSLGVMLVLTALVLLFKGFWRRPESDQPGRYRHFLSQHTASITVLAGIFLGVFVTLSSVGAGAFCAALLMVLHPRLSPYHIVGTDIVHAVPLTLIAGLGHLLLLGNVDFVLLGSLLIGSLPAIHLGTRLAARVPANLLQGVLASLLLGLGIKFAL
jgi:uncharacterized membrane protein YfcA